MSQESLGDFVSLLQDTGELVRISAPVDSALEVAEITRRVSRSPEGGPALFFESVRGSKIPLLTNVLGSRSRLCRAFGVRSLEDLAEKWKTPVETSGRWMDALKKTPFVQQLSQMSPRVLKTAYCQQIVKLGRDVNLWEFPIPRSWPEEQQPVITSGQLITKCPQSQQRSVSLCPLFVLDQQRVLPCWHQHVPNSRHWQLAADARQQLPVAIALGGHPAAPISALATLPGDVDPFQFHGLLQGGQTELIKCRTSDLEVPAHAELVIEGMMDPSLPLEPSPTIGLPTGFYSIRSERLPVIQVTAVTHRANPIFPAQIFGSPPSEDSWMRLALERIFLPWLQSAAPEIVDVHAPVCGGGRTWLFVSIRKNYPQQSHKAMHALWSHPLTMFSKGIVVVDADVNVHSDDEVWFAVGANSDPGRDLLIIPGPTEIDDHAGPTAKTGHRMGIDATRKLPEERPTRPWPESLKMPEAIQQQVTDRWKELGIPTCEEPER